MNYPEDFVSRCKKAYPDWKELHEKLDSGDVMAGRYLDDASGSVIGTKKILKLIDKNKVKKLRVMCLFAIEKVALYVEWGHLYNEQFPSEGG